MTEQQKESEIDSMGIAEKLNEDSEVWAGMIKDFNQVGSKSGLIRGVAMSRNIIKPIFEFVKNKSLNLDIKKDLKNIVYEYFEAYWKAIKLIFPDMFKNTEKKEYNILKSSQAEVMSKLFIKIYQMSDETSKKAFKDI